MRHNHHVLSVLICAAMAVALCGCTHKDDTPPPPPAQPVSVALTVADQAPHQIKIGVLVPPVEGEGSEFRAMADGAGIAAYRFAMSGVSVTLMIGLDDGTPSGADAAMRSLTDAGVAGVVMAATGAHTSQALASATAAGTPVIMVYDQPSTTTPGVWSIAPTRTAVTSTLTSALSQVRASKPVLVTDQDPPLAFTAVHQILPDDPASVAATVITDVQNRIADSVIVDTHAAQQALIVAAIQHGLGDLQIPVLVTPEALTPVFSQTLAQADASTTWLLAAGTDTDDMAGLTHGAQADAASAFFTALRLAANDPGCRNIYTDDTCASAAPWADIASHDAVVAVVRAVEHAGTATPSAVRDTLAHLDLSPVDGLAGPGLDFTHPAALPDSAVVVLHSTTTNPGVRPTPTDQARLFWFAATP